jgi:hypothetical protein
MPAKNKYYSFIPKGSSLESFKSVSPNDFAFFQYGEEIAKELPYTSSLYFDYYPQNSLPTNRKRIFALKNTLNSYTYLSQHYGFNTELGNKATQTVNLVSIPSIYYGSSIQKGTVELSYYVSGVLIAKLEDKNKNGELIQTTGTLGLNNVAGVVLYNEGFILLTGSWKLDNDFQETLLYTPTASVDYARWTNWGAGAHQKPNYTVTASYDLNFEGVNYINTITLMAHAEKGELNHSNNPTYIKAGQPRINQPIIADNGYSEFAYNEIKNTVKYPYENYTGSLEKHTYISKIGLYDENMNLIGIAKLAKPVKKTENRDFTFKLKIDI